MSAGAEAPIIAPGTPAPDFTLRREDLSPFTRDDLLGRTNVLVFYPFAFSPVCTDQLQVYEEGRAELASLGATLLGISCDSIHSQRAFREALGVNIEQLSDFHPKGATSKAFGAWFEPAGSSHRALVITGPDGVVRWSHVAGSLDELPGLNLIFDALAAPAAHRP